jgi:signal transduction histidine kinase
LLRLKQETSRVREQLNDRFCERERIARDLHDTFFQGIQGLLLSVQAASRKLPDGNESKADLEKTLLQSDAVMSQGRELVFNLRARSRSANDLGSHLETSADQFSEHFPSEFALIVLGAPKLLHAEVCEELCRLGREALCNAYRHSQASHIEVRIDYRPDCLRLAVSDDGIGIDSAVLADGGVENRWGPPRMRERAARIGANFRVVSSPGTGTIIQVDVPAKLAYADNVPTALRRISKLLGLRSRGRGGA